MEIDRLNNQAIIIRMSHLNNHLSNSTLFSNGSSIYTSSASSLTTSMGWVTNGDDWISWPSAANYHQLTSYLSGTVPTKQELEDLVQKTEDKLRALFDRYQIFDSNFTNAEVIAAKIVAAQLPKASVEFALSKTMPTGKRNVYLIVKADASNKYIVDVCARQYGNFSSCTLLTDNLPAHWETEVTYKTATGMTKRLFKECRPVKELSLRDAIALSTRYEIVVSPTELETHSINPSDSDGRKFLEKFGKEVGFKTTLAQLLLDTDPVIADKAREIATVIMKR